MPIIHQTNENNCKIAVWKMNETLESLLRLSKCVIPTKFKNEKRKKEFLTIQLLCSKILPESSIYYNKYGAPEVKNNFISISHSSNLTAIILSNNKVGLDVEKISSRPVMLASKFISKKNHVDLSEEKATLIWCCKEAIFKWYQIGKIDYLKDIKINSFVTKEKGQLTAEFKNQIFNIHYRKIDAHFLVYVCK
tara:strand:+ start:161 stop:739 length:579 start_codon:yes stop_codon:yes gene_type:complete